MEIGSIGKKATFLIACLMPLLVYAAKSSQREEPFRISPNLLDNPYELQQLIQTSIPLLSDEALKQPARESAPAYSIIQSIQSKPTPYSEIIALYEAMLYSGYCNADFELPHLPTKKEVTNCARKVTLEAANLLKREMYNCIKGARAGQDQKELANECFQDFTTYKNDLFWNVLAPPVISVINTTAEAIYAVKQSYSTTVFDEKIEPAMELYKLLSIRLCINDVNCYEGEICEKILPEFLGYAPSVCKQKIVYSQQP